MAVYFIRAGENGPVKIGTAVNPQRRLRYFQTAHYEPLSIIREIPGGRVEEAWLHRFFQDVRVRNEWFRFCAEMFEIVPPVFSEHAPDALNEAVRLAGSQAALGKICGVTQATVSYWINVVKRIPGEHAIPIETATGVSRQRLRPDLYPQEKDPRAPEDLTERGADGDDPNPESETGPDSPKVTDGGTGGSIPEEAA